MMGAPEGRASTVGRVPLMAAFLGAHLLSQIVSPHYYWPLLSPLRLLFLLYRRMAWGA